MLGTRVDALTWSEALERILIWASAFESRFICLCNVHSVMTARKDTDLRRALSDADMVAPDGMPVAWTMRLKGIAQQQRIDGPDLMLRICADAVHRKLPIFLYGGSEQTLDLLRTRLLGWFPELIIAGSVSPPYRSLTPQEDQEIIQHIHDSRPAILFVGLGCPKQEKWMAAHRNQIQAVTVGVGAAFDFHAGTLRRAPPWMQRTGLEWLFRLVSEPRRLWKRYLVANVQFTVLTSYEFLVRRGRRA